MSVGAMHATLRFKELFDFHFSRADLIGHLPQSCSRSQIAAAKLARKHGAAGKANGRQIAGTPINRDGVVLSQPMSKTTPSMGVPRIHSSPAMLARVPNNMAVGRRSVSPSGMTGKPSGKAA